MKIQKLEKQHAKHRAAIVWRLQLGPPSNLVVHSHWGEFKSLVMILKH